jgi:hypothetical protein
MISNRQEMASRQRAVRILAQNSNLPAIWMMRGCVTVLLIRPKADDPTAPDGAANTV